MNGYIVIRDFKPGDTMQCKDLLKEGVMSTLGTAFWSGLIRELTFQLIVLTAAIMFIFLGVPFTYCIAAIPFVVIVMFAFVWLGHKYSALEVSQEVAHVPRIYMSSNYTGFWVAESYEPPLMMIDPKNVKYIIKTEREIYDSKTDIPANFRKKIIGTISVSRNKHCEDSAWIKRLTVKSPYQRKGIASALVDEALRFCQDKEYSTVELVTSECHDPARELFLKKGFELKQMYHKPVVGSLISVLMYELSFKIRGNRVIVEP